MHELVEPFQDLEKKHPKGDQVKRVVILMIYLLHHPSRKIDIQTHFNETLDKHPQLKNIPDSLKHQSNFNKDWQWLKNNEIITPLTNKGSNRNEIYGINPHIISNILGLSDDGIDYKLLRYVFRNINKISLSSEYTIIQINSLKGFDFITFLMYSFNLLKLYYKIEYYGFQTRDEALQYKEHHFMDFFKIDTFNDISIMANQWIVEDNNDIILEELFYIDDDRTRKLYGSRTEEQQEIFDRIFMLSDIDINHQIALNNMKNYLKNNGCEYSLSDYFFEFLLDSIESMEQPLINLLNEKYGLECVFIKNNSIILKD